MTPTTVALRGSARDEVVPVAEQRPGYWMVCDPFGHVGARLDILAAYLDPEELAELRALGVRARRGRLLGRIAAKDAVCRWLADRGRAAPAPRAVRVRNDPGGRPRAIVDGEEPVRISLAHCRSVAVAAVASAHAGVDVEVIEPRGTVFARLALTERELRLGEALDPDEWVTRAWTIKEAVSKAAGTGLRGRPKDVVVHELDGAWAFAAGRWVHTTREGEMVVSTVRERRTAHA